MSQTLRFDGRVAIVTGAGRGLGREFALGLARRGARVVVNDLAGDESPAHEVVETIRSEGGQAVAAEHSVGSQEGAQAILGVATEHFGRIDIVVNNAGSASYEVEETLRVHLAGAIWLCEAAWPLMKAQGFGRFVNISSNVGLFGFALESNRNAYAAVKMGLVGLARNLAAMGAEFDIRANAVAPIGFTRRAFSLPDDYVEWMRTSYPAELVAPILLWLVHDDCRVSGQVFSSGGGRVAQVFLGETRGYADRALTAEAVRDHFDEIADVDGFLLPTSVDHEIAIFGELLGVPSPPSASKQSA